MTRASCLTTASATVCLRFCPNVIATDDYRDMLTHRREQLQLDSNGGISTSTKIQVIRLFWRLSNFLLDFSEVFPWTERCVSHQFVIFLLEINHFYLSCGSLFQLGLLLMSSHLL
jgi:hypothetical protein